MVFLLTIPQSANEEDEKRKEDKVTCILGKEIQLKHRAPVISIQVLDVRGFPLTDCSEVCALKLEKSAISKVQKHIFCYFKNGKKSIFAPEKSLKLPKMQF